MNYSVAKKLDQFFQKYNLKKFKKHQLLLSPEEKPQGVIFLKEGAVREYAISGDGEELVLNSFKSLSFFPMGWVVNDKLSPHYFEALTNVTAYLAPKQHFLKFIKDNPDVLFDLIKRIYSGLDGYFLKVESLLQGKAKHKLVTELLMYARRFGRMSKLFPSEMSKLFPSEMSKLFPSEMKNQEIRISLELREKDLAAQIGLSRETISRELQKLKKKGLIKYKMGNLIINDLAKLEGELI